MSASRDDLDRALSVAYDEIDKLRAQLAERDAIFADVLSIDVPRTAKALEQMRAILSASTEVESHAE